MKMRAKDSILALSIFGSIGLPRLLAEVGILESKTAGLLTGAIIGIWLVVGLIAIIVGFWKSQDE